MPRRSHPRKAALLAGAAFLFFAPVVCAHPVLARQLMEEGDWEYARREALRNLSDDPLDTTSALIAAVAGGIQSGNPEGVRPQLEPLIVSTNAWVAAAAHLALGHLEVAAETGDAQLSHFTAAFLHAPDPLLAESAATMLDHPLLAWTGVAPSLVEQAQAMVSDGVAPAPRWVTAWVLAANQRKPSTSGAAAVLTGFYRTQISPAIGSRCPMHPSCSSYFRQASDRHGFWTAVPMIGDRFVREPHHYKHRIRPMNVRGLEKSFDPLEYHDYWFHENGRPPVWHE
jgi:putative component of membrane protein insertase Oxa1/YidC/SpoIIIJ protein YidD